MKMDPSTINKELVILLFVKNMYNKEIYRWVAGAKNINTLLDAFKSAQMSLLKLKKYEGFVSDDEHTVHAVDQIMSKGLDMTGAVRSLAQTDGYRQKYITSTNSYSKQFSKTYTATYNRLYTESSCMEQNCWPNEWNDEREQTY